jgi:D-mannonate dehydratase
MGNALVELIVARVQERFNLESDFYQKQLQMTKEAWENWKKGLYVLNEHEFGTMIMLFTDYEWMLVQKVIRTTKIIPEKEQNAVSDFNKMKFSIAKQWMQSDMANAEIVEKLQEDEKLMKNIEVRIVMDYDSWGYNDILTFTLPAIERERVAGSRRELIQYMASKQKEN